MKVEVIENPANELLDLLENRIEEFNLEHWEIKQKFPLAAQIKNASGQVVAGAKARSFGNWLLLDVLWVSAQMRGQGVGEKLLAKIEQAGKNRGCKKCLLDTLDFQAMPFYKKHGYEVAWTQKEYPGKGCKYFMVKDL